MVKAMEIKIKPSINIKYDIGKKDLLEMYLPTPSHINALAGILDGVLTKKHQRAHIIYGPYGAGKSYFITMLINLLYKKFRNNNIQTIRDIYGNFNLNISRSIDEIIKSNLNYIPVILNGYDSDFEEAIVKNINLALKRNRIRLSIPGVNDSIKKYIKEWKKSYPDTFNRFLGMLKNHNYSINSYLKEIDLLDEKAIELFYRIFPKLTSGSTFVFNTQYDVVNIIREITKELEKRNTGLIIVYDEFGRYLQGVSEEKINILMQNLQNLAELANNDRENFSIVFVTHKPISTYFYGFRPEYRQEFSKIEKRYQTYEIKSDYRTFVSITKKVLQKSLKFDTKNKDYTIDENILKKYSELFLEICNRDELISLAKEIYPMHPITLLLLPRVSNIFGQNERTLFTFLHDKSSNGFMNFCENDRGYYYPYLLADYFFTENPNLFIAELSEYRIYTKQVKEISKLFGEDSDSAIKIYKLIMLWKITSQNLLYKLNNDLIAYSTNININVVENILKRLEEIKFIKYNKIKDEYEIFQGSSVNINELIQKVLATNKPSQDDLYEVLNSYNPYKVVYSSSYNSANEMTRFAKLIFAYNNSFNYEADIIIWIGINLNINLQDNLFESSAILKTNFDDIHSELTRIYAINTLLNNNSILREYNNIDIELKIERDYSIKKLYNFYEKLFTDNTTYIFNGEKYIFNNVDELDDFLSQYFSKVFYRTPVIVNDQINMFKITKIQERSIIEVIDLFRQHKTKHIDDYIKLTSPSSLIYNSIVNADNIDELTEFIRNTVIKESEVYFEELFSIVCGHVYGFGLRPTIALLIIIYSIIDLLDEILIFNEDVFVPNISSEDLYYKTLTQNRLKIVYSSFEHLNKERLNSLLELFPITNSHMLSKTKSVQICSGMHEWFIKLPLIVQQGIDLGFYEAKFLNIIASSRINPEKAVKELIETFDDDVIEQFKNSIEQHFDTYVGKLDRDIKNKLSLIIESNPDIDKIYKDSDLIVIYREGKSFIKTLAHKIDDTPIERWPLPMFNVLLKYVEEEFLVFYQKADFTKIMLDDQEKVVRKVELSIKGQVVQENLINMIEATKKTITQLEVEQIIMNLIKKYIQ